MIRDVWRPVHHVVHGQIEIGHGRAGEVPLPLLRKRHVSHTGRPVTIRWKLNLRVASRELLTSTATLSVELFNPRFQRLIWAHLLLLRERHELRHDIHCLAQLEELLDSSRYAHSALGCLREMVDRKAVETLLELLLCFRWLVFRHLRGFGVHLR